MQIRFWGVRGSVPFPGPDTVRYGGNTTCIEIRTSDGHLIVLDAGTGVFPLARRLLDEQPVAARIFITHSHWDHIHGLPFFLPLFHAGNHIKLYATAGAGMEDGPERVMRTQLQFTYFPVGEVRFKSPIHYRTVTPGKAVAVGNARVLPVSMNHPGGNVGYLVTDGDRSVFFTGDHEPFSGQARFGVYTADAEPRDHALASLISGVDMIIADCTYTHDEYVEKVGWGHGSLDSGIRLAMTAGASRLVCTHHESCRSDDELEAVFGETLAAHAGRLGALDVRLAREGDLYTL